MDEERRVLERLDRIDRLRAGGGSREAVLAEVRQLLAEGQALAAASVSTPPDVGNRSSDANE